MDSLHDITESQIAFLVYDARLMREKRMSNLWLRNKLRGKGIIMLLRKADEDFSFATFRIEEGWQIVSN